VKGLIVNYKFNRLVFDIPSTVALFKMENHLCNLTIEELKGQQINILDDCPVCRNKVGIHNRSLPTQGKIN
jgi:hypothetical protein